MIRLDPPRMGIALAIVAMLFCTEADAANVTGSANRLVSDLDSGDVDLKDQLGDSLAVNFATDATGLGDVTVQDITFLTETNFQSAGGTISVAGVALNNPDTVPTLTGTDNAIMSSPDGAVNDVLTGIAFGAMDIGFPTTPGQSYRAQVYTYEGIAPTRSFDVLIDGTLVFDDVVNTFNAEPSLEEFRLLQIDFDATGVTTTISSAFGGVAGTDTNPSWAAVSLERIPEPSAAMLAVVALLLHGATFVRRRIG